MSTMVVLAERIWKR